MAAYDKFDRRLESLVVESKTEWSGELATQLSDEDRRWIAEAIQRNPEVAEQVRYERMHTGFARYITVTEGDIERLYAAKFSG